IYRYFENKKEILSALRHEAFGFFIERQKKFIPLEDPLERVRRAARFYVQFALEEPDWFELMFNMGPSTVALGGEWAARPQETFDMFRKDVAECVACKCFGDEDVDTLVFAIWSTMHGLANLAVKKRLDALAGDLDVNELADKVVAFTTRRA
ncbi:MAG: WHG domain-containing protein, partial [Proteobacteria bacterium]|nr:WHG domain-containing protein [Pseudomonadota bacterium]